MPVRKLKQYLDEHNIKYVTIGHSKAYTAQEIAASSHISGKDFAKTVIVKVDGNMAMAVLPANRSIHFELLANAIDAVSVELATEDEFRDLFPSCEVGAMPPFGNLWDMTVYLSDALVKEDEITFNAGSHTELIRLKYKDFKRLVKPRVVEF